MLNKVVLIGRLTAEVDLKKTSSDIPYTYFTLAVNRPGNQDQTDFISCVAWRGTAELMSKYLNKGSLIAIEGRIEVYRTESNGNYETRTNVNVQNITFLESSRRGQTQEMPAQSTTSREVEEMHAPTQEQPIHEPTQEIESTESNGDFQIDFDSIKF